MRNVKKIILDYGLYSQDWFSLLFFIVGIFVLLAIIILGLRAAFWLLKFQLKDYLNEANQSEESKKVELDKSVNKVCEDKSKILKMQLKACLLRMDYAISFFSKDLPFDNKSFIEAIMDYGNALYRSNEILTILSNEIREKIKTPINQMKDCLSDMIEIYASIKTCNEKISDGKKMKFENDKNKIKIETEKSIGKIKDDFKKYKNQIETVLDSNTSHVEKQ